MIEAIGRGFRKQGFSGIGVDGLAKAAGVTSGAFYSHFGSKAGAFDIALTTGLDEVIEGIPKFQKQYKSDWVKAFTAYYLGKLHRKDLESGCAMASLTSEVVRFDKDVHAVFEKKMIIIVALIVAGLSGASDEDLSARAWSMLSILIGGVNLSRAMKSTKISDEVADAIKFTVIKVAGETRSIYD